MHECLCAWKNLLGNDNWLKRERWLMDKGQMVISTVNPLKCKNVKLCVTSIQKINTQKITKPPFLDPAS